MNKPDYVPDDGMLDELATEWLIERESGFSKERAAAFAAWRQNPSHRAAIERIEKTMALLGEMPAIEREIEARYKIRDARKVKSSRGSLVWCCWASVAAAALAFGFYLQPKPVFVHPAGERFLADQQSQRCLVLQDGTVLDLNIGSEVRVAFTEGQRLVVLEKGQAHFQVAHNPARPFLVLAGSVTVKAVGTAFDVRLTEDVVDVVVVEGKVAIDRESGTSREHSDAVKPQVKAGERAQVQRGLPATLPRVEKVDAPALRILEWRSQRAAFSDVPLRDVVARYNLRNHIQLVIEDTSLAERKIGGLLALDQVEEFVRLLEQGGDVAVDRSENGKIRLRKGH